MASSSETEAPSARTRFRSAIGARAPSRRAASLRPQMGDDDLARLHRRSWSWGATICRRSVAVVVGASHCTAKALPLPRPPSCPTARPSGSWSGGPAPGPQAWSERERARAPRSRARIRRSTGARSRGSGPSPAPASIGIRRGNRGHFDRSRYSHATLRPAWTSSFESRARRRSDLAPARGLGSAATSRARASAAPVVLSAGSS